MVDLYFYRDPEAEAEEKVEEEKAVVEEEAAVVDPGFNATGGDWDAAPAGFAGAAAPGWEGAGEDWSAAPAPTAAAGGEWGAETAVAPKDSQW
ncbi:unnamed protein product [Parascedosporium putredinis]|uniref:Small ribosomal subunit protein uS2 C-terminal domain-containing protein n=1 Tax=Parascedosporium putredinis TaxID=1442378 RepID=A0A9P1H7H3_9PEZI|nr:unnamed protein product [Parascedosporium putredinis]CAI8001229.1 unnamed protein product [Parascedosporium putredinis]